MKQQQSSILGRVALVGIPGVVAAFLVAYAAKGVSRLVEGMGPGLDTGTLAGSTPWWLTGSVFSVILLGLVVAVSVLLRDRPWASAIVSAVLVAALVVAVRHFFIVLPLSSVLGAL